MLLYICLHYDCSVKVHSWEWMQVVVWFSKKLDHALTQIELPTAWKVSVFGFFPGLYFPAIGLNTERFSVSVHVQSECGKIRTRKLRIRTTVLKKLLANINKINSNVSKVILKYVSLNKIAYRKRSNLFNQDKLYCAMVNLFNQEKLYSATAF